MVVVLEIFRPGAVAGSDGSSSTLAFCCWISPPKAKTLVTCTYLC